jgi:hypothetical protein
MRILLQIKGFIGGYYIAYWILIGFIVLMIGLIALILRKIRGITRVLGIIFLVNGVLCGITYVILKIVISQNIPITELPARVIDWLILLINNLVSPFGIFSLVVLIVGGICLIISLVVKDNPELNKEIFTPGITK